MNSVISLGRVATRSERLEDRMDRRAGPCVLGARVGAEIDAVEHERAEREHRGADLLALDDVALAGRALDQVVDEPVDALRACRAQDLDLLVREVGLGEDAVADRVVDVVVDVGDAIDDADDLSLERLRLVFARVREDSVPHLVGEVQPFGDPERLLVVAEMAAVAPSELRVERRLPGVPERRVARVVPEADCLDEILVEPERAGDDPGDAGRLERMGHPRAVVVAGRVDEDLRLPLQPPKRLGMDDPVAVALEGRADVGLRLGPKPATSLV